MTIGVPEESSSKPVFLFLTAHWFIQTANQRSFHSSIGLWNKDNYYFCSQDLTLLLER